MKSKWEKNVHILVFFKYLFKISGPHV